MTALSTLLSRPAASGPSFVSGEGPPPSAVSSCVASHFSPCSEDWLCPLLAVALEDFSNSSSVSPLASRLSSRVTVAALRVCASWRPGVSQAGQPLCAQSLLCTQQSCIRSQVCRVTPGRALCSCSHPQRKGAGAQGPAHGPGKAAGAASRPLPRQAAVGVRAQALLSVLDDVLKWSRLMLGLGKELRGCQLHPAGGPFSASAAWVS